MDPEKENKPHEHNGKDSLKIRLSNIKNDLLQSAITKPTGGATVDIEARTAINSIIDALQALGLTK